MALIKNLLKGLGLPHDEVSFILSKVKIAHFIEGRLRVVYKELCSDDSAYLQVKERLEKVEEISSFSINRISGSVIIYYEASKIIKNSFLDKLLCAVKSKYKLRG